MSGSTFASRGLPRFVFAETFPAWSNAPALPLGEGYSSEKKKGGEGAKVSLGSLFLKNNRCTEALRSVASRSAVHWTAHGAQKKKRAWALNWLVEGSTTQDMRSSDTSGSLPLPPRSRVTGSLLVRG